MSRINRSLIVSMIAAFSVGCSSERKVATALTCICIQDNQIPSYTERALSGDAEAAYVLSSTYSFKKDSLNTAIYWAKISYLNGDHSIAHWIAILYGKSKEKGHCENELLWLEGAVNYDYKIDLRDDISKIRKREFEVTSKLKRIDEIKRKIQNGENC